MFLPIAFYKDDFLPLDQITIRPTDLGYQRGYSIFDFFKLKNGSNPWIDWYLERLQHSCTTVGIPLPFSLQEVRDLAIAVLQKNQLSDGYLKIIISAGISEDGYTSMNQPTVLILGLPITPRNELQYSKGVQLITANYQRDIPSVKSTNYLQSTMLAARMKKEKAVDVLYFKKNLITEASRCNFYIVKENQLFTPKNNILKGITRRRILSLPHPPLPIIVGDLYLDDLEKASEAFISSTTKGILPVTSIDGKIIGNGMVGPHTEELMEQINIF